MRRYDLEAEKSASSATTIDELNGLMRLMMKSSLERMLNTEMDLHLGHQGDAESPAIEETKRSGNGRSKKMVQGDLGEVTLATPRARDGTF